MRTLATSTGIRCSMWSQCLGMLTSWCTTTSRGCTICLVATPARTACPRCVWMTSGRWRWAPALSDFHVSVAPLEFSPSLVSALPPVLWTHSPSLSVPDPQASICRSSREGPSASLALLTDWPGCCSRPWWSWRNKRSQWFCFSFYLPLVILECFMTFPFLLFQFHLLTATLFKKPAEEDSSFLGGGSWPLGEAQEVF